ncbi:MAG: hypothetical protein H0U04_17960 [Rubrobacter sp.]|nr:hypothetical protein [Rubrobacter sp.]MBA3617320.1 hypothetical protein [Rubrobacteraceae bacterium]
MSEIPSSNWPRPVTTPEIGLNALGAIYGRAIELYMEQERAGSAGAGVVQVECDGKQHAEKEAAGRLPSPNDRDAKGFENDRAGVSMPNTPR